MAGLTGGRVNRFNIGKQAKDYDAAGEHAKHWIPELENVPAPFVHEPWRLPAEQRAKFLLKGDASGKPYPLKPIDRPGVSWNAREGGGSGNRKQDGQQQEQNKRGGGGGRKGNEQNRKNSAGKQQRRAARVQHGYMAMNDHFE